MSKNLISASILAEANGHVRDLSGVVFTNITKAATLASLVDVVTDVRNGDGIVGVHGWGLHGQAATACNPDWQTNTLDLTQKVWEMKAWESPQEICVDNLRGTFADNGHGQPDREEFVGWLGALAEDTAEAAIFRLAWFGDTAASDSASGGTIREEKNVKYFNAVNGIFKRVLEITAKNPKRRTESKVTAEATYKAARKAYSDNAGSVIADMDALITDAAPELRTSKTQRIVMTIAMKDALDADMKRVNGSSLAWEAFLFGIGEEKYEQGAFKTNYNGIEVVALPKLDEIIQAYTGTEEKPNYPYRALYYDYEAVKVALGGKDELTQWDISYDNRNRSLLFYLGDTMDTAVISPKLVQYLY